MYPHENNLRTAILQYLLSTGLTACETDPNELRAAYSAERRQR